MGWAGISNVMRTVILSFAPDSLLAVGGVPLVVRAARALRAAGAAEIGVVAGSRAGEVARRLAERGVDAEVWQDGPAGPALTADAAEPVLVVRGDLLFEREVLAPLLAAAGPGQRRVGRQGTAVPAAVCPRGDLPRLLAAVAGEGMGLEEAVDRLGGVSPAVPLGEGLLLAPGPGRPAAALTDALLRHLAGSTAGRDGYLTTLLDRHLSRAITRRLLAWPVTPNQVTVVSIAIGLAGALGLATVSYAGRLAGVLALLTSSVLDGVDGELARARLEQSRFGARLDLAGDYAIHLATFAALGIGLARQGLPPAGLWAAGALIAGVAAAALVVHALVIRPGLDGAGAGSDRRAAAVQGVVERIAGRDYTYLLLLAALVGHLEWFLYPAAVGAWVFVAGLLVFWLKSEPAAPRRSAMAP